MEKRLEKFLFDPKNFKGGKEISSGTFGSVYLVQDEAGQKYAAKIINSSEDEDDKKMINREISIMIRMKHPTIIKFHGYSLTDFNGKNQVTILLDYAENGSLADYLNKVRSGKKGYNLDNTTRQKILVGISCAMMYLHRHNVIHRDLKPGNILLDENLEPHVSDFGVSRFYSEDVSRTKTNTQTGCVGTLIYMAPEVINGTKYDIKADVYSFGIIMYEIVTNSRPYPNEMNLFQLMNKVIFENMRPKFNEQVNEPLQLLIEQCWSSDPKNRPSFEEIFCKLAFNTNDPVYNVFEDEEETPKKYYLDNVDKNELLSYVDEIIDDNLFLQIQIKKLKDQIRNLENNMNQIDTLQERVAQLEEDSHQKDHIINLLNEKLQNTKLLNKVVFPYDPVRNNAFDGIMKYLSDICGGNVHDHGIVKVYMPTLNENNLKYSAKHAADVQNETNYAQSGNNKDSYLSYDFIDRRVLPTHYSIRSRPDGGDLPHNNHLQTWVIEGSNSGSDWVILDSPETNNYLDDVNASHTFNIQEINEPFIGFRFLRIRQTGPNTRNFNYLTISALEFFGSLFEFK